MPLEAARYWEEFFARLAATPSWKKYVEENHVEEVFLRGAELTPFFDEQIESMRKTLSEAGVAVAR